MIKGQDTNIVFSKQESAGSLPMGPGSSVLTSVPVPGSGERQVGGARGRPT